MPRSDGLHGLGIPSTNLPPGKGPDTMDVLGLIKRAQDGTIMAVDRATSPIAKLSEGLYLVAIVGGVELTVLALAADLVIGAILLRRLDRASSAAERIVGNDASQRLPSIGFGREFDVLVTNMNRMLDRLHARPAHAALPPLQHAERWRRHLQGAEIAKPREACHDAGKREDDIGSRDDRPRVLPAAGHRHDECGGHDDDNRPHECPELGADTLYPDLA